jgi:Lon protease-like protein
VPSVHRYRRIEELPHVIPVFPLQACILLPRASLPLQIFEPRYLAMLDDIVGGNRIIGIIQPAGEGGETGSPLDRAAPLRSIGCVGRLTAFQELENGRLLISLTGVARFELAGEVVAPAIPYRKFEVDYRKFADDFQPGLGEQQVDRNKLIDALRRYLEARGHEADWGVIAKSSTEQLVNSLSVASPFGVEEKQALLEARSLKARAETLVALAEIDLAGGGDVGRTLQ